MGSAALDLEAVLAGSEVLLLSMVADDSQKDCRLFGVAAAAAFAGWQPCRRMGTETEHRAAFHVGPRVRILLASAALLFAVGPIPATDRPNIVVIMSDDMGCSDIGCYGSEIETPVLDKLANHGLRYTRFYNTGRCCPTRASLLTGLYAHQAGIGQMTNDGGQPGYRGDLSHNAVKFIDEYEDENPDRILLFEHFDRAAIRQGKWKLVRAGVNQPWELYDIEQDRSELGDLSGELGGKAAELAKLWEYHAWRTRIFPTPDKRK